MPFKFVPKPVSIAFVNHFPDLSISFQEDVIISTPILEKLGKSLTNYPGAVHLKNIDMGEEDVHDTFPGSIFQISNLTTLAISNSRCQNLPSFKGLSKLKSLNLMNLGCLDSFPDEFEFSFTPTSLELSTVGNGFLEETSHIFSKIQKLYISGMMFDMFLWEDLFCDFSSTILNLGLHCIHDVDHIPPTIALCTKLVSLSIELMESLRYIDPSIGTLQNLRRLRINGNPILRHLPDSVTSLTNLELLSITDNNQLTHLPILNHLTKLKKLFIIDNHRCMKLPIFFSLQCFPRLTTVFLRLPSVLKDDFSVLSFQKDTPLECVSFKFPLLKDKEKFRKRINTMRCIRSRRANLEMELPQEDEETRYREMRKRYHEQINKPPSELSGLMSSLASILGDDGEYFMEEMLNSHFSDEEF